MNTYFQPQLLHTLKSYSKKQFYADLNAGMIVGIVALPLAIAFGIASGVTPDKGLYTTIIAGFLVSFFGGSKVQIAGPTGALIVTVYGVIQIYGMPGLAVATMIAGLMLIAMGILKMGTVIKFIPYPVIIGLNSGIAVGIFSSQVKDFLGLQTGKLPVDFIHKWMIYFQHIDSVNPWSVGVGIASILLILLAPKITKRIPGFLFTIIVVTVVAYIFREKMSITGIETIADRFKINTAIPTANPPVMNFETIQMLIPTGFTIAILAAIVSLLSATVADGVIGDSHDSNTELIAQGIANMVVPIFGGIPVTGAIARTMTNVNNGGRTPVAGIIHAFVLLFILQFLGGLTKHIPMACLAAILFVVSYNMSDWRTFKALLKSPKSDVTVLISTFLLTVIFNLTIAIEVGLLLAVLLFLRRISETTNIAIFKTEVSQSVYVEGTTDNEKLQLPKGVEVYEIEGPFFFGIANKFEETMKQIGDSPKIRIIRMRKVPFIDSTGLHNLENLIKLSSRDKIQILLSGVNENVFEVLKKAGLVDQLGNENVCRNINIALQRAQIIVNSNPDKDRSYKKTGD